MEPIASCSSIQLVIFDLAGTTVDYGCLAPVAAFVEGFKEFGITISFNQAREPMGMEKRVHIRKIGQMSEVVRQWQNVHGRSINEDDIDAMYHAFVPLLLKALPDYTELIPGVSNCIDFLKAKDIKFAATTGYFREAANIVLNYAAEAGFSPQVSCCATEVPLGRPAPWMIFNCMQSLDVYPPLSVVNVGDTRVDVESGLNAGVWSIGVAATGNEMGLSLAETRKLEAAEYEALIGKARKSLMSAGAHYIIDSVSELPEIIWKIEQRLAEGEKP